MARRLDIHKRLSKSHLEAIGRVAATWSLLELMMLSAISTISGVGLDKTIVMAGPANMMSWLDMLVTFATKSKAHLHKVQELEALGGLLRKLQTQRNYVVHATWQVHNRERGLIARAMLGETPSSTTRAEAIGIAKRGRQTIKSVWWTPKEMRHLASQIEESRIMLLEIHMRKTPASARELVADALLARTTLDRIRTMLDRLPDPFRK